LSAEFISAVVEHKFSCYKKCDEGILLSQIAEISAHCRRHRTPVRRRQF